MTAHCCKALISAVFLIQVLLAGALPQTAHAQTAPAAPPPPSLSKEELQAITSAVTEAVMKELDARQKQAAPVTPPAVALENDLQSEESELANSFSDESTAFIGHLINTLKEVPVLAGILGHVLHSVVVPQDGGRGFFSFVAILAATFVGALAAASGAYTLVRRLLPVTEPSAGEPMSLLSIFRLGLADVAAFAAVALICSTVGSHLFNSDDLQTVVAQWMLFLLVRFAFFRAVFDIFFRPGIASARLVPLDDDKARGAYAFLSVMAFLLVIRTWISIPIVAGAQPHTVAAGLLLNNALFVGLFFWAALRWREAIATWIRDGKSVAETGSVVNWLARCWVGLAGSLVVLLSLTHTYGAIHLDREVSAGLTWTLRIALLMIFGSALVQFLSRRLMKPTNPGETGTGRQRAAAILGQIARIGIAATAVAALSEMWMVDILEVHSDAQWGYLTRFLSGPLVGLVVGYVAVQAVRYVADSYLEASANAATAKSSSGMTLAGSSRLRTLVPVLRLIAIWTIVLVSGLLVLHSMGVNITPLLAGASVAGLAISFGSQSLVKDVVSGFFFLADDAFRVGEYIECGKAKGTVEGFTLRSIRLRHQDGQLHTVPFGQLGEITNFSRDWTTVKFNMMLDRDVDLEQVRKIAKRVGLEMKEDPRFADTLLDPMKLQGIMDVSDTNVTVRFKFNALPSNTVELERTAKVNLLTAFRDAGMLPRRAALASSAESMASAVGVALPRPAQDAPVKTRKASPSRQRKPAVAKA